MSSHQHLSGVYAAALTPLRPDFSLALDDVPKLLEFLAHHGCHGALLFGTTGEGPSFSPSERQALLRIAMEVRKGHPRFRLLAGTGTPSLEETIELTRMAFELGIDGVVVLPPYYYRNVNDEGLFAWFSQVLRKAVPAGGALFGYHVPRVTGVTLSMDLLARLKDSFPERFAGVKDSSGDPDCARQLGERFGSEILALTGNDSLFSLALQNSASGCITALANVRSTELRAIWDAHERGESDEKTQERINGARSIIDHYQPVPPLLKVWIAQQYHFRLWAVRPPLLPLSEEAAAKALEEIKALDKGLAS